MSDSARKGLGEQVGEKVTPQSQKSNTQVAKESVTGAADKAASAVQPDSEKSTTQKLGDSTRGGADSAQKDGSTYVGQAKDTLANAADQASKTLNNAAEAVVGKTEDAKAEANKKTTS